MAEDQDAYFEVRRSWHVREGRVREILSVFKDGVHDAWYSDNWAQQVEELVPLEISGLFFFDAEKIRGAHRRRHQQPGAGRGDQVAAGAGYRGAADRRYHGDPGQAGQGRRSATQREKVQLLETQAQELTEKITRLEEERTALENHRLRAQAALETAEMKFRALGGTYWQLRQVREGRKREIETRAKEVEGQLQTLAAGELPLALVSGLLRQVEHQDVQERLAAQAGVVVELLGERDGRLIERLEQARVSGKTIELVRAFLDGDREERQHAMGAEPRLGLSQRAHGQLHHLGGPRLGDPASSGRPDQDARGACAGA